MLWGILWEILGQLSGNTDFPSPKAIQTFSLQQPNQDDRPSQEKANFLGPKISELVEDKFEEETSLPATKLLIPHRQAESRLRESLQKCFDRRGPCQDRWTGPSLKAESGQKLLDLCEGQRTLEGRRRRQIITDRNMADLFHVHGFKFVEVRGVEHQKLRPNCVDFLSSVGTFSPIGWSLYPVKKLSTFGSLSSNFDLTDVNLNEVLVVDNRSLSFRDPTHHTHLHLQPQLPQIEKKSRLIFS